MVRSVVQDGVPQPGGAGRRSKEQFTADGSSSLQLTNSPLSDDYLLLFVNGLLQSSADYSLDNDTITFASGAVPEAGDRVIAVYDY